MRHPRASFSGLPLHAARRRPVRPRSSVRCRDVLCVFSHATRPASPARILNSFERSQLHLYPVGTSTHA